MRKYGVLGGTFDPIHFGHLVIAEDAWAYLGLEKVFLVPAFSPPHKLNDSYSTFLHRVRMTQLAIADNPHLAISCIEAERPGPSYTVDTMRALQTVWGPDVEIHFIIGMDSLANILSWYKPDVLLTLCHLVVAERAGYNVDVDAIAQQLPGLRERMTFIDTPELSISSTDIQKRVAQGLPIRYQLPAKVEKYIVRNGLYRGGTPPACQNGRS